MFNDLGSDIEDMKLRALSHSFLASSQGISNATSFYLYSASWYNVWSCSGVA